MNKPKTYSMVDEANQPINAIIGNMKKKVMDDTNDASYKKTE